MSAAAPADSFGIAWDYEESIHSYYHVFAACGPLDGLMEAFTIDVDHTEENDRDIQTIVDALRRIAARLPEAS